jgi:hypothetical protein
MAKICLIDSANIVNGNNLMKGNTDLIEWNTSLEKITSANYMFSGCSNLETFNGGNTAGLSNVTSMFSGCSKLTTFVGNLTSVSQQ